MSAGLFIVYSTSAKNIGRPTSRWVIINEAFSGIWLGYDVSLFVRVPEYSSSKIDITTEPVFLLSFPLLPSLWWSILTLCGLPSRVLEKGIMVSGLRRKSHDSTGSVADLIYKGYWWQNRGILSNLFPQDCKLTCRMNWQAFFCLISISWFLLWHQ